MGAQRRRHRAAVGFEHRTAVERRPQSLANVDIVEWAALVVQRYEVNARAGDRDELVGVAARRPACTTGAASWSFCTACEPSNTCRPITFGSPPMLMLIRSRYAGRASRGRVPVWVAYQRGRLAGVVADLEELAARVGLEHVRAGRYLVPRPVLGRSVRIEPGARTTSAPARSMAATARSRRTSRRDR